MASIFGSNRVPQLNFTSPATTLTLSNCTIIKDEPEPVIISHESPLTGHKINIVKGHRWIIEFRVNLFKYTSTDAKTLLTTLWDNLGDNDIHIKRFSDESDWMNDMDGNDAHFTLVEVRPAFLTQSRDKDILYIRLESNDLINLPASYGS